MGGIGIVKLKKTIVDCHTKKWISYTTRIGMALQLKLYKIESL